MPDRVTEIDKEIIMTGMLRLSLAVLLLPGVSVTGAVKQPENLTLASALLLAYVAFALLYPFRVRRKLSWQEQIIFFLIDTGFSLYLFVTDKLAGEVLLLFLVCRAIGPSYSSREFPSTVLLVAAVAAYAAASVWRLGDKGDSGNLLLQSLIALLVSGALSTLVRWQRLEVDRAKLLIKLLEVWTPRSSIDRSMLKSLNAIVDHFQADQVVLIMPDVLPSTRWTIFSVNRDGKESTRKISGETSEVLLKLPSGLAVSCAKRWGSQEIGWHVEFGYDEKQGIDRLREAYEGILNIHDADAFASVAYSQAGSTIGRIFVTGKERFGESDLKLLLKVADTLSHLSENQQFSEKLINAAAEAERFRLSQDMHDTTIQPYLGIKLSLEALRRNVSDAVVQERLSEIVEMVSHIVGDLRSYVGQLRGRSSLPGDNLINALNRQAQFFNRYYGIRVTVNGYMDAPISGQVGAEIFQIACEGLSNVLRHTSSRRAFVNVRASPKSIRLTIGNEFSGTADENCSDFSPGSILDRTNSLGGRVKIERNIAGQTLVHVEVPNLVSLDKQNELS